MRSRLRYAKYSVFLLPLAFLGIFFVYPILALFDISLRPDGVLDLSAFTRLLTSDYYLNTLLFTVYQALLSTAATLALALPCAYVFARYRFRGRSLLLSLGDLALRAAHRRGGIGLCRCAWRARAGECAAAAAVFP